MGSHTLFAKAVSIVGHMYQHTERLILARRQIIAGPIAWHNHFQWMLRQVTKRIASRADASTVVRSTLWFAVVVVVVAGQRRDRWGCDSYERYSCLNYDSLVRRHLWPWAIFQCKRQHTNARQTGLDIASIAWPTAGVVASGIWEFDFETSR